MQWPEPPNWFSVDRLPIFASAGDLKTYLLARRHLVYEKSREDSDEISSRRLTSIALDVAKALSYLADLKYVHRYLSISGVLLMSTCLCVRERERERDRKPEDIPRKVFKEFGLELNLSVGYINPRHGVPATANEPVSVKGNGWEPQEMKPNAYFIYISFYFYFILIGIFLSKRFMNKDMYFL